MGVNLRSIKAVTVGSIVLAILIAGILLALDWRERDQRNWVRHTYEVILLVRDIQNSVSQAEIAVRGYLISGNAKDLGAYQDATRQVAPELARLQILISDNPRQVEAAANLANLVHDNLTALASIVAVADAGATRVASEAVRNGIDASLVDRAQAALHDMQDHELALLQDRQRAMLLANNSSDFIVLLMACFGAAWIYVALRYSHANARERVRAEHELADSEARYRLLADNSTDIIAHRDVATDQVTYFSPAVRDILGRAPEDLLGRKWLDFVHPDDRDALAIAREAVVGRPAAIEAVFRMMHADGRYVWIEVHGRYIPGGLQRPASVQSTWRDVTDRKTAEDEAVRLRKEADKANKAKSDFLAMMSHELRTPMAGVLGIADLLLLGDSDIDERQRLTKQLKRSALSLLDILNDILDFSKIEAGKLEIENEPFSLGDVLADLRGLFGPAASAKGLIFEVTTGEGLRDGVRGDAKRLRQVMINLVNNAVKFTSHGRIDLRVEHKLVGDNQIELCGAVKDTGIGMSSETVARLFQPFVQADSSTSRNFGGTGLGLTIARLLVSAMKGRIWVESELGRGATFFFTVPLATVDVLAPAVRHERRMSQVRSLRPLSILVAEDTDTVRQIIVMMLKRMSHVVDAVEHGAAAVAKMKAGSYDLVLMDMQMPVMDGIDATKAIRSMEGAAKRTPIIALTADAIYEHRQRYFEAGADAIVTKPIGWEALVAKFAELVPDVAVPAMADRRKSDSPAPSVALVNESLLAELDTTIGSEALAAFFKSFADGLARYEADIGMALADNDLPRAKKSAHALKGLSSQMGADRIAATAAAIEVKAASLDEARGHLPVLSGTVRETLLALSLKYAWANAG